MPKGHKQGCKCAVCRNIPEPVELKKSHSDKPHFEELTGKDIVRIYDKPHDEAPHE